MQVRSTTLAEVGIAPCELKFRAAGKKGKETPDRRSSEGHAASCSRERRWWHLVYPSRCLRGGGEGIREGTNGGGWRVLTEGGVGVAAGAEQRFVPEAAPACGERSGERAS